MISSPNTTPLAPEPNNALLVQTRFYTSKVLLSCGPSVIMVGDAIMIDNGALHVVGVLIDNPSTFIVREVMFGRVNGFQLTPKTSINNEN